MAVPQRRDHYSFANNCGCRDIIVPVPAGTSRGPDGERREASDDVFEKLDYTERYVCGAD